ncbi:MAG: hypothetical protein ABIO70_31040 [Pseudomonadota bacterium]
MTPTRTTTIINDDIWTVHYDPQGYPMGGMHVHNGVVVESSGMEIEDASSVAVTSTTTYQTSSKRASGRATRAVRQPGPGASVCDVVIALHLDAEGRTIGSRMLANGGVVLAWGEPLDSASVTDIGEHVATAFVHDAEYGRRVLQTLMDDYRTRRA